MHAHFHESPDDRPDEHIFVRADGPNERERPVYVLVHADDLESTPVTFIPLLARHLVDSGWVRLNTDDTALIRIARALEALVATDNVSAASADLVVEAVEAVEHRRRARPTD